MTRGQRRKGDRVLVDENRWFKQSDIYETFFFAVLHYMEGGGAYFTQVEGSGS